MNYSLSKEDAKELLKPYAQEFYDAIQGGFDDYSLYDKSQAHIHNKTTRANLVRSYVLHRIKQIVAKCPKLKLRERKRMIAVLVEDKVVLRFKKLNDGYRSENVKTKQVKAFRDHEPVFEGVAALPVDAGWRVNKFYGEIDDVHFVCPDGPGNLWRIPLEDLNIIKKQPAIFPIEEEQVMAVVTVKPELADANRKTAD